MYTSVQTDAVFFLACLLAGVIAAFLYDIIRISRRIVAVGAKVVCGEDIIFLIISAVILFCAAYTKNSGEVRWHGIIGGVLGAGCYAFVVRNRFVNFGTLVIKWLIKAALFLLRVILFPVRIILRALKKPVEVIAWYTSGKLRRAKRFAKCGKERLRMRLLSAASLIKKR